MHRTRTGGSPYGASHFSAEDGSGGPRLSEDERELARLLGRRVAELAIAVRGPRP
jgi:NAD(P)H dehydrogenase (quinone)